MRKLLLSFLLLQVAGLSAFAQMSGLPSSSPIDVKSLGVKGDGSTVDATAIAAAMTAHPTSNLYFRTGTYVLNNASSADGIDIPTAFHGTLTFEHGAQIACNTASTSAGQCVVFNGNTNIRVNGLTVTYTSTSGLPIARNLVPNVNAILVEGSSSNISFDDTTIIGSPNVGIWNTGSSQISYRNTNISLTSADGIHFENCSQCGTDGTWTYNTGDDAIAFTNVANTTSCNDYAYNSNISNARADGIAIAGACGVVVDGFIVNGSAYDCSDIGYYSPNSAVNVTLAHGKCYNNGNGTVAIATGASAGPTSAIDVTGGTNISIDDVLIVSPGESGVSIATDTNVSTHVVVNNVEVQGAASNAFAAAAGTYVTFTNDRAYSSTSQDYNLQNITHLRMDNNLSDHSGDLGILLTGIIDGVITNSTIRDCNGAGYGGAYIVQNAAGTTFTNGVYIVDDQSTATCYAAGDSSNGAYRNRIYGVTAQLTNGALSLFQNANGGTNDIVSAGDLNSGSVHLTGQHAAVSSSSLCSSSVCPAGQYEVNVSMSQSGTACTTVGSGKVTLTVGWTDAGGVARSLAPLLQSQTTSTALGYVQTGMVFETANANASQNGTFIVSSNGAANITYALAYAGCTTGTATYNADLSVTRLQ